VLTWDFDVLHHDVVFTVFRLASPIKVPATAPMAAAAHLAVKNSATTGVAGSAPGRSRKWIFIIYFKLFI
jgi:hypothetical protein